MSPLLRRPLLPALAVFILALAVRLPLLPPAEEPLYGEAVMVARSLASGAGFASPFGTPTGPTAHVPPVYVALLALPLRAFGYGPAFHLAVLIAALCLSALGWALLPVVAARFGLPLQVGVIAGMSGALFPFRKGVELDGAWDAPLVAPLLALLCAALFSAQWSNRRTLAVLAAASGLLVLTQPAALLPICGLVALQLLWRRLAWRDALIFLIITVAVLAPWTLRNLRVLGGFCFVRDNIGLEFGLSNSPGARPTLAENLDFGRAVKTSSHPNVNPAEAMKLRELGELNYYRARLHQGLAWVRAQPGSFLRLTAARAGYFLAPKRANAVFRSVEVLLTLSALIGLWLMARLWPRPAAAIAVIWASFSPLYFLIQADERYRYPIEWSVFLCAAFLACSLAHRLGFARLAPGPGASSPV